MTRSELCEDTQQEPLKVTFALLGIICPEFCFVFFFFSGMGSKNINAPKLSACLCSWQ